MSIKIYKRLDDMAWFLNYNSITFARAFNKRAQYMLRHLLYSMIFESTWIA